MKPSLSSYFLTLTGICIQAVLWLGQVFFFPEVNIWAHFFLSLTGLSLQGILILILTIERKAAKVSTLKMASLISINFICGINSFWFFLLCAKQILRL